MLLPPPKQHFLEEFCSGKSMEMLKLGSAWAPKSAKHCSAKG